MARSLAWAALLAATALFMLQLLVYYPDLPEQVASHFDGAGHPDGYSSKRSFLLIALGVAGLDFLLFAGMGWLLRKLPASWVNMPNREYWLAPERKEETVRALSGGLLWFGAATQAFMVAVFHLTIRANLGEGGDLSGRVFWPLLIGYLAYTLVWLVLLYRRFRRPGGAGSSFSDG